MSGRHRQKNGQKKTELNMCRPTQKKTNKIETDNKREIEVFLYFF